MWKSSLILMALATLAATNPLPAQDHKHRSSSRGEDKTTMMCGGGKSGMMPGMRTEDMKPGAHADTVKHRMDMRSMMQMMGPPGPTMILRQKERIGLSATQVTRLQDLQKQAQSECMNHMHLAMSAHHAALPLLDAAAPDFTVFTAKLKEASAHMAEGHVAMAKAAVAAREVLTAEQQQKLKSRMHQMHHPR